MLENTLRGGQSWLNIRDQILGPLDGVQVEIRSRIEPQLDALLTTSDPIGKHVRLEEVRLSAYISEKL
jgi:hypothetical protein